MSADEGLQEALIRFAREANRVTGVNHRFSVVFEWLVDLEAQNRRLMARVAQLEREQAGYNWPVLVA